MRANEFHLFLLSVFLMLLSLNVAAQSHHLPQPQMSTDEVSVGGPPPPGLVVPIDEGAYFLAAAGFLLGIYFSRPKKS